MMRRIIAITLIIASLGIAVILWPSEKESVLSTQTLHKLTEVSLLLSKRLAAKFSGEMVASRSGLFERERLHVKLNAGNTGADMVTLVSNGVNMFGVMRGDAFLIARSKGASIVAFAAGYLESPVVFYALEKSGIHTPLDFIGKRVARQSGKDTAIIYDALLENLHISRGQIREISRTTDITALLNGDIDVWPGHVGEESYILQKKGIAYNVIRPFDYGIHVPGTVYFTSEKTIRDYPSIAQKFLRAVIDGWKLTYADYSKSVPLIAAYDDKTLTPERALFELKEQRDFVFPLGRRFTEFDETQWKQLRDILINERLIDDSFDLSKAVNYDFLREAYRKPINFGDDGHPGSSPQTTELGLPN